MEPQIGRVMKKQRLDQLVFDMGLTESRERAKTTIMSGNVFVNGQRMDKPGAQVSPDADIRVSAPKREFASRGGYKLKKALDVFGVSPNGLTCIDCGASTGGFTDCLLKNGAASVYAVDVGYGQLAWSLRNDERVVSMERTNIRNAVPDMFPGPFDLGVMDLSFISLGLVLPAVSRLLKDDGELICLIKPQFEAGRENVGKKGVVREPEVHRDVLVSFLESAAAAGFTPGGLSFSPIKGPEGNIEYLGYLKKGVCKGDNYSDMIDPEAVVKASHDAL